MGTIWFILFVIFLIMEIATSLALVSIWFCMGSLAALLTARMGGNITVQLIVFIISTAVLLIATRPFVKKISKNKQRTNADRIIGMDGIVTEKIDNTLASGAIKIDGKEWTARSVDGHVIEQGQKVTVLEIQGVKVIVSSAAA